MENTTSVKTAISNQFQAALAMLQNAIEICPDEHWDTTSEFWYIAYHTVFWTDYYLTIEHAQFQPPKPFTLSEFDFSCIKPERIYSKAEVMLYLHHCQQKAQQLISDLSLEKLNHRWNNEYKDFSVLELLLYNLRHIQHHSGQLNLLLRQKIDKSTKWVTQA